MARIRIDFDTQEESLADVIAQLNVEIGEEMPEPTIRVAEVAEVIDTIVAAELEATAEVADEQPDPTAADEQPDPPAADEIPDDVKDFMKDSNSPSVELDADGIPWDERIHSANKKITASSGKWQKRRSLATGVYETVFTELKAAVAIPDAGPAAPPADDAPPPPPDEWTWTTLVQALTQAIADKTHPATKALQDSILKDMGIEMFPLLSPRTELYDDFANKLSLVHP